MKRIYVDFEIAIHNTINRVKSKICGCRIHLEESRYRTVVPNSGATPRVVGDFNFEWGVFNFEGGVFN